MLLVHSTIILAAAMVVLGADNSGGVMKKGSPPPPPKGEFKPTKATAAVSPKISSPTPNAAASKAFKKPQGAVEFSLNGLAEKAAELEARRNAPKDSKADQEAEARKKQEKEAKMVQNLPFEIGAKMFADAQRKQDEASANPLSQSNLDNSGWGDSSLGLPLVFNNPEPEMHEPTTVNNPAVTVEPGPLSPAPVKTPDVVTISPSQQPPVEINVDYAGLFMNLQNRNQAIHGGLDGSELWDSNLGDSALQAPIETEVPAVKRDVIHSAIPVEFNFLGDKHDEKTPRDNGGDEKNPAVPPLEHHGDMSFLEHIFNAQPKGSKPEEQEGFARVEGQGSMNPDLPEFLESFIDPNNKGPNPETESGRDPVLFNLDPPKLSKKAALQKLLGIHDNDNDESSSATDSNSESISFSSAEDQDPLGKKAKKLVSDSTSASDSYDTEDEVEVKRKYVATPIVTKSTALNRRIEEALQDEEQPEVENVPVTAPYKANGMFSGIFRKVKSGFQSAGRTISAIFIENASSSSEFEREDNTRSEGEGHNIQDPVRVDPPFQEERTKKDEEPVKPLEVDANKVLKSDSSDSQSRFDGVSDEKFLCLSRLNSNETGVRAEGAITPMARLKKTKHRPRLIGNPHKRPRLRLGRRRSIIIPFVKGSPVVHQPEKVDSESDHDSCATVGSESDSHLGDINSEEEFLIDDLVAVQKPEDSAHVLPFIVNPLIKQTAADKANSPEPIKVSNTEDSPLIPHKSVSQNIPHQASPFVVPSSPHINQGTSEQQIKLDTKHNKEKQQDTRNTGKEVTKEHDENNKTNIIGSKSDSMDSSTFTCSNYESRFFVRKLSENQSDGFSSYSSDDEIIVVDLLKKSEGTMKAEQKIKPVDLRETNFAVAGCIIPRIAARFLSAILVLFL